MDYECYNIVFEYKKKVVVDVWGCLVMVGSTLFETYEEAEELVKKLDSQRRSDNE